MILLLTPPLTLLSPLPPMILLLTPPLTLLLDDKALPSHLLLHPLLPLLPITPWRDWVWQVAWVSLPQSVQATVLVKDNILKPAHHVREGHLHCPCQLPRSLLSVIVGVNIVEDLRL